MIKIDNLQFAYRKRALLFDHLELHLAAGRIYGLLGRNGAGKSSLLGIIQGLLFPQAGRVEVLGKNAGLRAPEILADCFFLPEHPHIPPALTIRTFARLYAPFYPAFDEKLYLQLLSAFEVEPADLFVRLSLGQQKKAMLAFGLATNARILLLDEPTNGLDIPSKKQFRSVLAAHLTEDRLFVLSTHQIRDLQSLIDTAIILEKGRVVFQESLADLMDQLEFTLSYQQPREADVLYWERVAGGYAAIRPADRGDSLEVDLELLFNAVIERPELFQERFKFPHYVRS